MQVSSVISTVHSTSTAYNNIVKEMHSIFGTQFHKNHVQNKIRLLKGHYSQFKNAFASMSGFAWNFDSKRFEAEDEVWDTLIKENPLYSGLRFKTINNWDKLELLFATSTATGSMSHSGRDMHERFKRRMDVDSLSTDFDFWPPHLQSQSQNYSNVAIGQRNTNESDKEPTAPHSGSYHSSGQGKFKRKFPDSEGSVWEKAPDKLLLGMEKMCTAMIMSAKQLARFDCDRNVKIFEELKALNISRPYLMRCYKYLCEDPSKASAFLSLPEEFRTDMLQEQLGPMAVLDYHVAALCFWDNTG